ncbi:LuxR C-terminal-related transcriptional regulator [Embleya sp. NPDC056575]|uniref:LuxR C-terminal-related transcriptional regulator n=1 Tax=unclassified Embleya TaxID=2699296 RepID=UPI0036AF3321
MLHGRTPHIAALEALVRAAARGHGGAVVLVGDIGTGKSALLDAAAETAMRVPPGAGAEAGTGVRVARSDEAETGARVPRGDDAETAVRVPRGAGAEAGAGARVVRGAGVEAGTGVRLPRGDDAEAAVRVPRGAGTEARAGVRVARSDEAGTGARVPRGDDAETAVRVPRGAGAEAGAGGRVVRGADGVGGVRVLRGAGVESEARLPYAGLHVVLREALHLADRLPRHQAEALRHAVHGTAADPAAPGDYDRFLVGAAALSLLGELADEQPLLVLVDDAHWLDQESADALLFAARRLAAEPVAIVFAARDGSADFDAPGLPVHRLEPLDDDAGTALLDRHAPGLTPAVRRRLLRRAAGNPLALVELAAALTPGLRTEADLLDDHEIAVLPASWRVRRLYDERIATLPAATRTLLTLAAADDTGDPALVLRAGRELGAVPDDLEPAEQAGLIHLTPTHLAFHHPLARAAAYHGATLGRRNAAHHALAAALPESDRDRQTWHLAAATVGHDAAVADRLEETAEHFRARGGRATVATAYRRAAQLTEDPRRRAHRLTQAALAAAEAGRPETAAALAEAAAPYADGPAVTARLASIRATVEHTAGRPDAARLILVEAARATAPHDPDTAAGILFEAVAAAWDTPDPAGATTGILDTLAGLDFGAGPAHTGALALHHLATGNPEAGHPLLRRFTDGTRAAGDTRPLADETRLQGWDMLLGDYRGVHDRAEVLERRAREQGAIGILPTLLLRLARCRLFLGRHEHAHSTAVEGLDIARSTANHHHEAMLHGVLAVLAAIDGDEDGYHAAARHAGAGGGPAVWTACAEALLDLGRGRHETALTRLTDIADGPRAHVAVAIHGLADHVEAAARLGRPDEARRTAERFTTWAHGTGTPWAHAVALRCRALLAADDTAGDLYRSALEAHRGDGRPFEAARTELLYGEWLRRNRRRAAARTHLTAARTAFETLRAGPWQHRAAAELRAAGAPAAGPVDTGGHTDATTRLTPQELHVARLAATGLSNRDIGARLFLSPRTVGYHLSNAYPKLGITSRAALGTLDWPTA